MSGPYVAVLSTVDLFIALSAVAHQVFHHALVCMWHRAQWSVSSIELHLEAHPYVSTHDGKRRTYIFDRHDTISKRSSGVRRKLVQTRVHGDPLKFVLSRRGLAGVLGTVSFCRDAVCRRLQRVLLVASLNSTSPNMFFQMRARSEAV